MVNFGLYVALYRSRPLARLNDFDQNTDQSARFFTLLFSKGDFEIFFTLLIIQGCFAQSLNP